MTTLCPCSDPAPLDHHDTHHKPGAAYRCVRCPDVATEGGLCVAHERGRGWWK